MIDLSYNLPKLIYPSGFPKNDNYVVVPNGGGVGTTDWIDNNIPGVGDNWSVNGSPTLSIVTGNGFVGNAQRIVATQGGHDDGINAFIYNEVGSEIGILENNRSYTLHFHNSLL